MADLLIKNISLPPSGKQLCFCVMHNGTVWHEEARDMMPTKMEAIELPSHGRLGDLDKLKDNTKDVRLEKPLRNGAKQVIELGGVFAHFIDDAPTVIPPSEGK